MSSRTGVIKPVLHSAKLTKWTILFPRERGVLGESKRPPARTENMAGL